MFGIVSRSRFGNLLPSCAIDLRQLFCTRCTRCIRVYADALPPRGLHSVHQFASVHTFRRLHFFFICTILSKTSRITERFCGLVMRSRRNAKIVASSDDRMNSFGLQQGARMEQRDVPRTEIVIHFTYHPQNTCYDIRNGVGPPFILSLDLEEATKVTSIKNIHSYTPAPARHTTSASNTSARDGLSESHISYDCQVCCHPCCA